MEVERGTGYAWVRRVSTSAYSMPTTCFTQRPNYPSHLTRVFWMNTTPLLYTWGSKLKLEWADWILTAMGFWWGYEATNFWWYTKSVQNVVGSIKYCVIYHWKLKLPINGSIHNGGSFVVVSVVFSTTIRGSCRPRSVKHKYYCLGWDFFRSPFPDY